MQVLLGGVLPVALAEVNCDGSETSLLECSSSDTAIRFCGRDNTVLSCINTVAGVPPHKRQHGQGNPAVNWGCIARHLGACGGLRN